MHTSCLVSGPIGDATDLTSTQDWLSGIRTVRDTQDTALAPDTDTAQFTDTDQTSDTKQGWDTDVAQTTDIQDTQDTQAKH